MKDTFVKEVKYTVLALYAYQGVIRCAKDNTPFLSSPSATVNRICPQGVGWVEELSPT